MYACWERSARASIAAASGGRLSDSRSAAAPATRRRRSASRSQKIAPKLLTGRLGDRDGLGEQASRSRCRSRAWSRSARPGRTSRCRSGCARARPRAPATGRGSTAPRSRYRGIRSACTSGRTTRFSIAVATVALGPERVERRGEVGPLEAAVGPRAEVLANGAQVLGLVGEAATACAGDRVDHRVDVAARGGGVAGQRPVGRLQQRQRVGLVAKLRPARASWSVPPASAPLGAVGGGPPAATQPTMFSHSARWSSWPMQSSPNRSESASTTTRPVAVPLGDDQRLRPAPRTSACARASTREPLTDAAWSRGTGMRSRPARAGRPRGRGRPRRAPRRIQLGAPRLWA